MQGFARKIWGCEKLFSKIFTSAPARAGSYSLAPEGVAGGIQLIVKSLQLTDNRCVGQSFCCY